MKKFRKLWGALPAFAAALLLQGCIYDREEVLPDANDNFRITVTMTTPSVASTRVTRAAHEDDYEEKGTAAEDYIDLDNNDVKLAIFDKAGTYLFDIECEQEWTTIVTSDGTTYHTYETELEFPEDYSTAKIDNIRNNGVQVLVVANWNKADTDAGYADAFRNADGTTQRLADVWKDRGSYNYRYQPSTAASAGKSTWMPDLDADRLIPMFGIGQSTPFTQYIDGRPVAKASVQMQRVLAKIEVVDAIEQPGVGIEDVVLTDFNDSGRLIPDVEANPDWNQSMSQVDLSSIPEGVNEVSGLTFFREGEKKWVAYVPEKALQKIAKGDPLPASRTHVDVTIGTTGNLSDYLDGGVFPLHFARYDDKSVPSVVDESWNHILRNHIYRYTVKKIGLGVDIHLHVIPWYVDDTEEWDFTDNVSLKPLTWGGSYTRFDEEKSEVVLTLEKGKLLEGIFQVMSPINGNWFARLVPLGDADPRAISFVDKYGNVIPDEDGNDDFNLEIHGKIPGPEESSIFIRALNYDNAPMSRFRLEFYVENLGTWVELPMVKEGNESNYIIIRPSNELQ